MRKRAWFAISSALLAAACGGGGSSGDDDGTAPDAGNPGDVAAIPLTSPDGTFYTAPLTIGAQSFAAVVDTGSTTTAVAGASCTNCNVDPMYTPGDSATDMHQPAQAQYGSGSWNGEIFSDQTGLGAGTPAVSVNLASITSQTGFFDFNGNGFQGLLGLGGDGLLVSGTTSYLTQVVGAGVTNVLSFEMCDGDGGTMWLGGYDPAAATASPQYTEMNTALPYYVVNLANLTLGGESVGFSPTFAIADTGTTLFYVPTAVANGVKSRASQATDLFGAFTSMQGVDCAMAQSGVTAAQIDATLPPLSLTFNDPTGTPFTIESPATRSYLFDGGGGLWCIGLVDNAQLGANITLMGDMGLRGFLTIFDLDHQTVGFAPDPGCAAHKSHAKATRAPAPLRERGHVPAI